MTSTAPDLEPITRLREELADVELKVLTTYSLADAIREGAGVTEQLTGGYVRGNTSCALGAGWIAAKARGYIQ